MNEPVPDAARRPFPNPALLSLLAPSPKQQEETAVAHLETSALGN